MPATPVPNGTANTLLLEPMPAPVPGLGMCRHGPHDAQTALDVDAKVHSLVRLSMVRRSSQAAGGVAASGPQG